MKPADNCLVSRAPRPGSYMAKMGLTMPDWATECGISHASFLVKMLEDQYEYLAKLAYEAQQSLFANPPYFGRSRRARRSSRNSLPAGPLAMTAKNVMTNRQTITSAPSRRGARAG